MASHVPRPLSGESDIRDIEAKVRFFAEARNWSQFHSPRNLVLALVGEVGELAAEFQWLADDEAVREHISDEKLASIEEELADVLIYLVRLADVLGVQLGHAVSNKIEKNGNRYPVDEFRDSRRKAPHPSE